MATRVGETSGRSRVMRSMIRSFELRLRTVVGRAVVVAAVLAATIGLCSDARADDSPSRADIAQAFFENMAVTMGHWAHPTLDVDATDVTIEDDGVHIGIRYRRTQPDERPVLTSLVVPVSDSGSFGGISVERDTSFFPPFLAMTLFKNIATQIISAQLRDTDDRSREQNLVLRAIQKKLRDEWDSLEAVDLCRLVVLYRWVDNGSWQRFRNTSS